MRECPWCHRMNLNVYSYCMGCGRGFEPLQEPKPPRKHRFWPFGAKEKDKAA